MTGHQHPPRAPRIGITTYQEDASWRGWHRRASLVPRDYLDPIAAAGALPVLLPPDGNEAAAADLVSWLDGLLLVGGPDIGSAHYGRPDPSTGTGEAARDTWEIALTREALRADLPLLGVCRGMQLLNVVCGGTLHQDIADPRHQPEGSRFGEVDVRLDAERLPGTVLGDRTTVACYHHQAVEVLGDGLVVTGTCVDGGVESLQHAGRTFVVGVQWHPEAGVDAELFKALVHAAGARC
ncbi:gamma-glutamyl-gamma-aminobutyrate hydrolase family protein [Saccharothrix isguenensis]